MKTLNQIAAGSYFKFTSDGVERFGRLIKANESRAKIYMAGEGEQDCAPRARVETATKEEFDAADTKPEKEKKSNESPAHKPTPSKRRKGVELNDWGFNPTSQAGQLDSCFNGKAVTIDEMHKKLGFPKARIKSHCQDRVRRGLIKETDDGYIRVDGKGGTPKKASKEKPKSDKAAKSGKHKKSTKSDKPKRKRKKTRTVNGVATADLDRFEGILQESGCEAKPVSEGKFKVTGHDEEIQKFEELWNAEEEEPGTEAMSELLPMT